jgi:hypothetical protein
LNRRTNNELNPRVDATRRAVEHHEEHRKAHHETPFPRHQNPNHKQQYMKKLEKCADKRDVRGALHLDREMRRANIHRDKETYMQLLRACKRSIPSDWTTSLGLLYDCKNEAQKMVDVDIYTEVLNACGRGRKLDKV